MQPAKEGKGLRAFLRELQGHEHPLVGLSLQLPSRQGELVVSVVQILPVFLVGIDISFVDLVVKEHIDIDEGDPVVSHTADDPAVFFLVRSIHAVQHGGDIVIQICHLGKLPGRQGLGDHITLFCFRIGKGGHALYLRHRFEGLRDL